VYFSHPNFSSIFRDVFPPVFLGMVTHSYFRNWQSVTSFALQECGISAVLVRTLGLYYNTETFHFKLMNRIPNSGPNLKVTSKTTPSKKSSLNFRTPIFDKKMAKKCENYTSKYGKYTHTSCLLILCSCSWCQHLSVWWDFRLLLRSADWLVLWC
jgi:hypothetical protein